MLLNQFAHLGLLLNEDRSKLSKRQGDVAVEDFRVRIHLFAKYQGLMIESSHSSVQDKGFLPSGLVNFVALLGWNPASGNNQEVFKLCELEEKV